MQTLKKLHQKVKKNEKIKEEKSLKDRLKDYFKS